MIDFCLDVLEQEQFTYEVVIPRVLRSSRSVSSVPDGKARLSDPYRTSQRRKRSPNINNPSPPPPTNTSLSYRIRAFNHTFDLSLVEDEAFLAPSFVTQHYDRDRTWLTDDIEHCFYKGHVNRNPSSTVSISLCHGLVCRIHFDIERGASRGTAMIDRDN